MYLSRYQESSTKSRRHRVPPETVCASRTRKAGPPPPPPKSLSRKCLFIGWSGESEDAIPWGGSIAGNLVGEATAGMRGEDASSGCASEQEGAKSLRGPALTTSTGRQLDRIEWSFWRWTLGPRSNGHSMTSRMVKPRDGIAGGMEKGGEARGKKTKTPTQRAFAPSSVYLV